MDNPVDIDVLVRSAQQGSREDFARLVEMHYDQIFRFAFKFLGNRENAEDVTQQSCIKLARVIGQFRFESTFSTWLYRLVINCARDFVKSSPSFDAEPAEEPFMSDNAEAELELRRVLARIASMGDGFHEAVVLVHGEGLTHQQVAEILGIKESTVSWRIHEVRNRLESGIEINDE